LVILIIYLFCNFVIVERSKSPNVSAVSNISSASTLTVSSRSSSSYQDLFGERVVFELQQIGKRLNTMENILLHKSSKTVSEVIDYIIDYMASLGQYVLFIGRRRSTKNGLFNNEKNI
jgi:hypothetical protein